MSATVTLVLALGTPALAQDPAPEASLDAEITVTSTLPGVIPETEIPGDDLEAAGPVDLAGHLRSVPGLSAVRRGGLNLVPTIRGLRGPQVAISVDGTRSFAAGPARMDSDLSHLGPHVVSNLRVVKGPYALTWGSGALSAIDLVTRRGDFAAPDSKVHGAVGGRFGDNDGRIDGFTNLWGGGERFRYFVGLGHRSGDDYEAGDGSTVPADYRSNEARLSVGYRPNDRWELSYLGGYQEQRDIDYPGRLLDATYFYQRSHTLEMDWVGEGAISAVEAKVYANRKDHLMNNDEKPTAFPMPGRIPPFGLRVDLPTESNTRGGRLRIDRAADGDLRWSFGADHYRLEQSASREISRRSSGVVLFEDVVWPDAEIESTGIWAQAVRGGARHRLGATVRIDALDASAATPSDFYIANVTGDTDQDETNVSAAVSANLRLDDRWGLDLGVGRAVRSATALERYSDRFPSTRFQVAAEHLGNPLLDPEASLEFDVGVRYADGDSSLEIGGFWRRVDDFITAEADPSVPRRLPLSPPAVFRYVNGDRATYYGAELALRHRLTERWWLRGDIAWLRGTDETLDEPMLGITPLTAHLGLRGEVVRGRLWLDLGGRFTDDQDRVATSRGEIPTEGAFVSAVGMDLRFGPWLVELDLENLTDETWAHHLNARIPFTGDRVLEPGRTWLLAIRHDF
ncbi:MAG: TonB-dependent receptor [Acidobacteriota bacterium]